MMRWRFAIPVLVVLALVGLLGYGLTRSPDELPSALIGKSAPGFSVPRLSATGQPLSQSSLIGQVSVVNFFASWCVTCRAEHPLLMALGKRGKVALYGMDYKDTRQGAQQWLGHFGNPFTAVGFDRAGTVGINWGVAAVPETFILDKRGVIRYKRVGPIDYDTLHNKLLPLIRRLKAQST